MEEFCVEENGWAGNVQLQAEQGGTACRFSAAPRPQEHIWRAPRYYAEPFLTSLLRLQRSEIEDVLSAYWLPAAAFASSELFSFMYLRKSLFVALTEGAFEMGPKFASAVEAHVWASAIMWCLAAVQVLGEKLRKNPETAWIHRRSGEAFLSIYFIIVLPTSLYLTIMQRIDYLTLAVGAVLLDTAVCTTYFLCRGWHVGRWRKTSKSLALHGRLMQCGIMMSMSILPQRLLQLYLTAQLRAHHQLNYTISIGITSILFVLFGHFWDGPRAGIWMNCIGEDNAAEAYWGGAYASKIERWIWRVRWIVYASLHWTLRRAWAVESFAAARAEANIAESPAAPGGST